MKAIETSNLVET